jgi:predicted RNA binding protein YcfA (HicA-like mRNA interferase family)
VPVEGGQVVTPRNLPRTLSQKTAKKLLEEHGWTEERGGKHVVKMTKPGHRPVTLPMHKGRDWSPDLTHRILKQAGLIGADDQEGGE